MYRNSAYLTNGFQFVWNQLMPRHKKLSQLMIYATTACQSRCLHCNIWQKKREMLSLWDIKKIMNSKCVTSRTTVGLEGSEFVLHPQAKEIMEWFYLNHPNFTLLSNGLATDKVIGLVKEFKPKHLYLSLDGPWETYLSMRGVDGFNKVMKVLDDLKDVVPVSLMFCLSPFNSFKDLEYVIDLANEKGVDLRIGIYGTMDFFDTTSDEIVADAADWFSHIPKNIHTTSENYDYVALYDFWKKGYLKLRCHSITSSLVIHPNGNVPVCQNLGTMLGNIHDSSLDDIFNSVHAVKMQMDKSKHCNGCWINFHRKYDIILMRNLERLFPKQMLEMVFGKYQWCEDNRRCYKNIVGKNKSGSNN